MKLQSTLCYIVYAKESSFSLFSVGFAFILLVVVWVYLLCFQSDHPFYQDSTKYCSRFHWKRMTEIKENEKGTQELCQIDMKRAFT